MFESWFSRLSDLVSPNFCAGFIAGLPTAVVCAPFDTIRVRMQVETFCEEKLQSHSLLRLIRNTLQEEGMAGLYAGFSVTLVAMPVQLSLYFALYEKSKKWLKGLGDFQANVLAAVAAGSVSNIFTNPLWLVRTRMMTQHLHKTNKYTSLWQALARVSQEEGWTALFQGVSASLLGLVHVVVQFPVYEWMKQELAGDEQPSFVQMLYLTAVPKLLASAASYPQEVLRSRLCDLNKAQRQPFRNLRELVVVSWKLEGLKGFYVGFWVNSIRILPATFATLWTYEQVLHLLHRLNY